MKEERKKITSTLSLLDWFLAGLAVLMLGYFFWALHRGFDIRDEAFCLVRMERPEAVNLAGTFAYILNSGMRDFGISYLGLRLLGLFFLTVSSGLIGLGAYFALRSIIPASKLKKIAVGLILSGVFGGWIYYYRLHPAPTYNLWAAVLLNFSIAGAIFLVVLNRFRGPLIVGLCFCAGLLAFAKPPSAIVLLALIFVFFAMTKGWRFALMVGIAITAGTFATIGLVIFISPSGDGVFPAFKEMLEARAAMLDGKGQTVPLPIRYLKEMWALLTITAKWFMWPIIAVPLCLLAKINKTWISGLGCLAVLVLSLFASEGWLGGGGAYHKLMVAVMGIVFGSLLIMFATGPRMILSFIRPQEKQGKRNWLFPATLVLLALAPFLGAAGTSNLIYGNLILHLAPWGVLLCLVADKISTETPGIRIARHVAVCGLVLFSSVAALRGGFVNPQALAKPIHHQTEKVTFPLGDFSVLMDVESATAIKDLRQILKDAGYKEKDTVLGFCNLPGLIAAIGADSPAGGWLFGYNRKQNSLLRNKIILETSAVDISSPYILRSLNPTCLEQIPDLKLFDINFPDAYRKIGQIYWPKGETQIEVWAPQALR